MLCPENEQGLLKARIEIGEVVEVREVFAISVDDGVCKIVAFEQGGS